MWSNQASEQIESIHEMMASGHRSVHMERHTLILWGLSAAVLILVTSAIFTHQRFPVNWVRAGSMAIFISIVLAGVAYLDIRLTQRSRELRDESISFVQKQLTKVWWFLIGLIVLINLGMNFYGGGYMFYSLVLVLMGLALYVHGLFSRQMLSLAGTTMVLLGLASISLRLPFPVIEWLTIFCFGLGWPLLGLTLNHPLLNRSLFHNVNFILVWLLIVTLPTFAIYASGSLADGPDAKPVLLEQYMRSEQQIMTEEVVTLAAGSTVPVEIELTGDVLEGPEITSLPVLLSQKIDIALTDGKPDGRFRVADGRWKSRIYNYRIRDFNLTTALDRKHGPKVNLKLRISTDN